MSQERIQPRPYLKLLALAALLGLISAVITFIFLVLVKIFGVLYQFPDYVPRVRDLLLAVLLGLIGALAGWAWASQGRCCH